MQNTRTTVLDGEQSAEFQGQSNVMGLKSRLQSNMSRKRAGLSRLQIREIADCAELDRSENVGAALKAARLRLDKDIATVSEDLKIRHSYIEGLEAWKFDDLPSMIYVRGFVRSYAHYLGLDAEECLFRFKSETSGMAKPPQTPIFLEPKPEVRLPQGSMFILAALLAVGLYGGWYLSVAADRKVLEREQSVPADYSAVALPAPLDSPQQSNPTENVGGPAFQIQPLPSESDSQPVTLAVENGRTMVLGRAEDVVTLNSLISLEAPNADVEGALEQRSEGQAFGDAQGTVRIVLRARGAAWIRVEDETSQVLIQRQLQEGDQYFTPNQSGLILSARDAGALEVTVDGVFRGPLGKPGQPLPAVSLDLEALAASDPS